MEEPKEILYNKDIITVLHDSIETDYYERYNFYD